jgi:proline dehydrogenase
MQSLTTLLRQTAGVCLMPLAARAAKSYIAGPELGDALRVLRRLAEQGIATTLGFWDGTGDTPESVAEEYLAALDSITQKQPDSYLSIKLPALGNSSELLKRVIVRAQTVVAGAEPGHESLVSRCGRYGQAMPRYDVPGHRLGSAPATAPDRGGLVVVDGQPASLRIHFDSLGPEAAEAMWSAAVEAAAEGVSISCSLPGRWRRSLDDAERAIEAGIIPRVVKGQWPDQEYPEADLRQSFMSVVKRLAGQAPHVAIASHDVPLAQQAIEHLRKAGTTCELELLYGLPQRAALEFAQRENVAVRVYVPYGKAYLPYCLGQARRNPRLLWWLMRDALRMV